jgi:hypothetical protein
MKAAKLATLGSAVALLTLATAGAPASTARKVSIPLGDGQSLSGILSGTGRTGVVLSHMLDGSTQVS